MSIYPVKVITFFLLFYLSLQRSQKTRREEEKGTAEQLRADLTTGKARGGKQVYIEFPRDSDHANHFLGQVCLFVKGQNKRRGITRPLYFVREYTKQNESWSKEFLLLGFRWLEYLKELTQK